MVLPPCDPTTWLRLLIIVAWIEKDGADDKMNTYENHIAIPDEYMALKIYLIRGQKVMLDMDLAELYGVETKNLKRAVRRNIDRFPEDFMFELSSNEFENLRCQFGTSAWESTRYAPMAFTEQGIAMLSSVLNSRQAIAVNIQIIRVFVRMRELIQTNKYLERRMEELEQRITGHNERITLLFEYLEQFINQTTDRRKIGFKRKNES
jgi:phage regulator Rha-like protein